MKDKKSKGLTDKEIAIIESIKSKFQESGVQAVSTSNHNYDFIDRYLTEAKNILLWDTELEHHQYYDLDEIKRILDRDNRIKILLIKYGSTYDR